MEFAGRGDDGFDPWGKSSDLGEDGEEKKVECCKMNLNS